MKRRHATGLLLPTECTRTAEFPIQTRINEYQPSTYTDNLDDHIHKTKTGGVLSRNKVNNTITPP
jgi:hypothetical protein